MDSNKIIQSEGNDLFCSMNMKLVLYLGIVLLVLGILSQIYSLLEGIGLYLIIGGVLCKLAFIIGVILLGKYRIGKEFIFLLAGLVLFFIGKSDLENPLLSYTLIITGISLKIVFVILFIRKLKAGNKK
jgi:hypothetical protein